MFFNLQRLFKFWQFSRVCFIAKNEFLFFWFKFQFRIIQCILSPVIFIWKNYVSLFLTTWTFLKRTGSLLRRLTLSMDLQVSLQNLIEVVYLVRNTRWQCCGLPEGIAYGGVWSRCFPLFVLRKFFPALCSGMFCMFLWKLWSVFIYFFIVKIHNLPEID